MAVADLADDARQSLGSCWSVAVAADPHPGFAAFRPLDGSDPDIAWIIASKLDKKRLSRLLDATATPPQGDQP